MSSIATSVEEQTITINEISKNVSETSNFAQSVSDTLQNTILLEKKFSRKLSSVSTDAQKIAKDAKDASAQTALTRQEVNQVEMVSVETFKNTQRIEDQVHALMQMYQQLHQIVIQFKVV